MREYKRSGDTDAGIPTGSPPQKGVTTYSISANRQKPFAGAAHAAIFNTWRRFRNQAFYFVPPLVGVYFLIDWAEKK